MATLILIRLDCKTTEDWGADEIRIRVNGNVVWSGDMNEGDQRGLGNMPITFSGNATIQLIDEDWPDGDDNLGVVTVDDQDTAAVSRAARFTQDDADYTLWYSVYGEVYVPTQPPATPPGGVEPDPADPANPGTPGNPGAPGDPSTVCPLCHLKVIVRDPVEGLPVDFATVNVIPRGLTGETPANGEIDFGVQLPGPINVTASKSGYYPFPGQTNATISPSGGGPTEVTVYLSKVRVIDVQPRDLRWYVNLDPNEASHHGRDLTITATVQPPTPGVRVYFTLDANPINRTGLSADQQASMTPAFALTNDQGRAQTRLRLSTYGGDRFRVSASLSQNAVPGTAGTVLSGWIEVWRKIYYEVIQMQKPGGGAYWEMPAGTMGHVTTAMGKVFIEMISLGAARNIDNNVENFDSADAAYNWADNYTTVNGVPWKVNYAVVGYASRPETKEVEEPVNTTVHTLAPNFRPYDFNGTNPILSAKYKPASGGSWQDFPAGKVTLVGTNPFKQIRVNFTGMHADPTTTPHLVKVSYKEAPGANGWGGSSLHLILCRGTFDEYYAGQALAPVVAGTSIHEPGHSLGLVMEGQAWETNDSAHSGHCKYQACVMWYQGYTGRPHDFHPPATEDPGCHTYMRGLDMSRAGITPRWNFPR